MIFGKTILLKGIQKSGSSEPPPVTKQAPLPHEPAFRELIFNFETALKKWKDRGYPLVSKQVYRERRLKCGSCPKNYWDGKARLGLGKCKAPGCGCTRLKLFIATERCPIGEWKEEPKFFNVKDS